MATLALSAAIGPVTQWKKIPRDSEELAKYKKMASMLPQGAVENKMIIDGIHPASLFDSPINTAPTPAKPLVITKNAAKAGAGGGAKLTDKKLESTATKTAATVDSSSQTDLIIPLDAKPPPGMSMMEEMKWRQAQRRGKPTTQIGDADLAVKERRKSIVKPERMVALKPRGVVGGGSGNSTNTSGGTLNFAANLKPVAPKQEQQQQQQPSTTTPPVPKPGPSQLKKVDLSAATNNKPPLAPPPTTTTATKQVPKSSSTPSPAVKNVPSSNQQPPPPPPVTAARRASVVAPIPNVQAPPKVITQDPKTKEAIAVVETSSIAPKLLPSKVVEFSVLDDGTKLTRDVDGAIIQENPNGIVIVQFPDGQTRQTNPDGTIMEVSADGQRTVQKNPDGMRIESFANGESTSYLPDGVILQDFAPGGDKLRRQITPDGVEIITYADGRRVQIDSSYPTVTITQYGDGRVIQFDSATGQKLLMKDDGSVEVM